MNHPHQTQSAQTIAFKQPFIPKDGFLNYGVVILMLIALVVMLARKFKPRDLSQLTCKVKVIEKTYLSNKTVMYMLQYQDQRFLLVDNQHALAIQEIQNVPTYDGLSAPTCRV